MPADKLWGSDFKSLGFVPRAADGSDIFEISADLLTEVFPRVKRDQASLFAGPLNLYLARYEIDSICRIAAFLGQVGVECRDFRRLDENLNYSSADRLKATFGAKAFGAFDPADFVNSPEELANQVYANKNGNSNTESGDGWTYRGRGLIQITGKGNYAAIAKETGVGFVANPEWLVLPSYAVMSACAFWKLKGLAGYADSGDIEGLTALVNAKKLDLATRIALTERAVEVLRRHAVGAWE